MTLDTSKQQHFMQYLHNRSFNSNASGQQKPTELNRLRSSKPGVQNSEKHAPTKENKDNQGCF